MFFQGKWNKPRDHQMLSTLEVHPQTTGLLLCTGGDLIPDSLTHKLCFLLLFLHYLFSENSTDIFPPVDHYMTSNQDTSHLTLHFHQWWQKKSHTLFSKQRTKILHWAIYHFLMTITMMNRTTGLNKNGHLFFYLIYLIFVVLVCISCKTPKAFL